MPKTKSAKKAHRKSLKNRERNLIRWNSLDKVLKNFAKLVKGKKFDEAKAFYPQVQKALDKAAKQGVLEKNTASRKKARFARQLKASK